MAELCNITPRAQKTLFPWLTTVSPLLIPPIWGVRGGEFLRNKIKVLFLYLANPAVLLFICFCHNTLSVTLGKFFM